MSAVQLYRKLEPVYYGNETTLQKQIYRWVNPEFSAFPLKKATVLLSDGFRNQHGFFKKTILEFYLLWHIKAIYTEQSVSKPWHWNLERWLIGYTHTEKVLPCDPARILKGTNLQWTALQKSPSGLWSTWAWARIPGSGHDVSSHSVKKGVSSCKQTKSG